ncbi:GLPGLI family protein [Psychroflexus salarius]|jgi:GLPGLI family protein|uniref:GLPGLI family protein n=1 Tax=Psychroflexus salarius TaxID=1155689 RepID=A0A1M4YBE0_9FLAO|nr:GLPGLI family protein [Psychroflexus salarius]SHF03124.1 GLPGLI family protein [Psychroflexus salarius]
MKNLLTIILTLFFQIIIAQTNSATVIYKINLNKDSIHNVSDRFVKEMMEQSDSVYATLKFNSKESNYFLDFDISKMYGTPNLTRIFGGSDNLIYYNQENKEFLSETLVLDYPVIISKKPIEWKILNNETKLINGYLCKKAIGKRAKVNDTELIKNSEFIAWFCPEIPFNFGPERFHGLPGLVLECNSNIVKFELEKITWHKEELEINKPNSGEIISEEEFKNRAGRF